MIITRNSDSTLSRNLVEKSDRFIDQLYDMKEMLDCEKLYAHPPKLITENKRYVYLSRNKRLAMLKVS